MTGAKVGEELYIAINKSYPELAGKLTGMFLEATEVLSLSCSLALARAVSRALSRARSLARSFSLFHSLSLALNPKP